jgi:predicted transcriptional regulator
MKKDMTTKLTKAEEEIMQMFWTQGPSTVSQLIEKMEDPKPPHSTISSFVRILEKKGFLDHKTYGRTYEYFPIIEKKSYSKFSLKNLVSNYFEGSMNEMVSFLVEENDLSLTELSKIIDQLENKKS